MTSDGDRETHHEARDWLSWIAMLLAAAWVVQIVTYLWLAPDRSVDPSELPIEDLEFWAQKMGLSRWSGQIADLGASLCFVVGFARLARMLPSGRASQLSALTAAATLAQHGLRSYGSWRSMTEEAQLDQLPGVLWFLGSLLEVVAMLAAAGVVYRLLGASPDGRGAKGVAVTAVGLSVLLVVPNAALLSGDVGVWDTPLGPFRLWQASYFLSRLALIVTLGWAGWPRPKGPRFVGHGLESARALLWIRVGFTLLSGLVFIGVSVEATGGGAGSSEGLFSLIFWVGHLETLVGLAFVASLATMICSGPLPHWARALTGVAITLLWFRVCVSGGLVMLGHLGSIGPYGDPLSSISLMTRFGAELELVMQPIGLLGAVCFVVALSLLPRAPGSAPPGHVAKLLVAFVLTAGFGVAAMRNGAELGSTLWLVALVILSGGIWVLLLFSALLRAASEGVLLPSQPSRSNSSDAVGEAETVSENPVRRHER